jgi:hypothetical protein
MSHATGYIPRDYKAQPRGTVAFTSPFDLKPIPKSEWKGRIDYLKEQKARLSDVVTANGLKASDQNGLPYCWAHGTVNAMRVLRAKEGQLYLDLSATAVAAQIKGFRESGGNTFDAIPHVAKHGVPTFKTWPQNKMDRSLVTEEMKDEASLTTLKEWYEMEPNDMEMKATSLLSGIPVIGGYSHMGHMMCDLDLIYKGDEFGVLTWNSWGETWGNFGNGTMELWGRKAVSFDQAAPRVVRVA